MDGMGESMRWQDAGMREGQVGQGRSTWPVHGESALQTTSRLDTPPPPLSADVALFHDLDGSLLELAARPDDVVVAPYLPGMLDLLRQQLGGALAIVSGRQISMLDQLLHPLRLASAGLHGAELRRTLLGEIDAGAPDATGDLAEALRRYFGDDARIVVEDKGAAVALHYRLAPERAAECSAVASALAAAMGLAAAPGKMVIEVLPASVNKGMAVQALMAQAPFAGRRPVFVGDDLTDENGILVVQALGGYGVKVGAGPSSARYRLPGVAAVHRWLAAAAGLRNFS